MDVLAIEAGARKPRSACRNLFGRPSDGTENIRLLQQLNEQVMETSKQRWNFDFRKCVPLDGRYEWRRPAEEFNDRRTTSSLTSAAVQTEPVATNTTTMSHPVVTSSSTNFRRKRQATITGKLMMSRCFVALSLATSEWHYSNCYAYVFDYVVSDARSSCALRSFYRRGAI